MKIFESARVKLTSWYLIIVMLLSVSVSISVYQQVASSAQRALIFHEQKIDKRLKDFNFDRPFESINKETVNDIKTHTFYFLISVNILILILSGGLGYFLAGKTLAPIEEMVEKQKKFIADAAHEVKTPLTAIKTILEVQFRNKNLTVEDAKISIKSALEEVDDLSILIKKLLDESKYENDQVITDKILLNNIIESTIKKFEQIIQKKGIHLEKSFERDIFVKGNENSIRELITILLDNAIKFNKDKEGEIKINLSAKRGRACIEIINTGRGIAEENIYKIFDRFFKESKSRSRGEKEGYGLGLSIAKEIVEKHKGNIEVRSEPDKETKFTVFLPRGSI